MNKIGKHLSLLIITIALFGFTFSENVKTLNSNINIVSIDSTKASNYRQTCFSESNNDDNLRGAYYVGNSVNPKYGYFYSSSNTNRARSVLDTTSMLVYNPGTFSTNGVFELLSNITLNDGKTKITKTMQNIPIINNKVGRNKMAGLFVLKGMYHTVLLGSNNNSNFLGYRTDYNQTTPNYVNKKYTFVNSPVTRYSCAAYYVAKCGDGVVDNVNKPGGSNTDGKNGILVGGDIIKWSVGSPNEECDDGKDNGKPGKCNSTCDGLVEQIQAPTCKLTVTEDSINWNIFGTFDKPANITIKKNLVDFDSHSVYENNGIRNIMLSPNKLFNIKMEVKNSGGSNTCETSYYVSNPVDPTPINLCGNGKINKGEECDDGSNFGSGCDNKCKLVTPTCSLNLDVPNQILGSPVTFSATKSPWARYYSFELGDGNVFYTGDIKFKHIFTSSGKYNQNLVVENDHPNIAAGVKRPTITCKTSVKIIPTCTITVEPQTIELGDHAKISWQIWPEFKSAIIDVGILIGTFPYEIDTNIGDFYVGLNIKQTGQYNFSLKGKTDYNFPFSCTGVLNVIEKEILTGKLEIEKTLLTPGKVSFGNIVEYKIELKNVGDGIFYNAYIKDILPNSLNLVSTSITGTSKYMFGTGMSGNDLIFDYFDFDLSPGETVYVYITGEVKTNTSSNSTTNCALTSGGLISCVMFPLKPEPSIKKYQSTENIPFTTENIVVKTGDLITYKIDFANIGGGNATGVRIVDYMPSCIEYLGASISGVSNANFFQQQDDYGKWIVEYTGFDLDAGQTGYMIVTGQIMNTSACANSTTYKNDSYIYFYNPTQVRNSSVIATRSLKSTVILTKYSNPNIHQLGDDKRFKIKVENKGPNPISNVTLHDVWPDENCIEYLNWTSSGDFKKNPKSLTRTNKDKDLLSGQSFILRLSGKIKDDDACAKDYINEVELTYNEGKDTYTGKAEYEFSVEPRPVANVSIIKTANKNIVSSGDDITYTITYQNIGNTSLLNYTITDFWPAMIDYVSSSSPMASNTDDILRWHFGTLLAPGQTGQIIVSGKVSGIVNKGSILNTGCIDFETNAGTGQKCATVVVEYEEIPPNSALCNTLTSSSTMVIVNENHQGSMQFSCSSQNNVIANEIRIDCGNGTAGTKLNTNTFTHKCNYTYNNNVGANNEYTVSCYVDSDTNNNCKSNIRVGEGYYGVCGNGILEDGEQCDLGLNNNDFNTIINYLDFFNKFPAGNYGNSNFYCKECIIRHIETNEFVYQPPQCLGTNTTISVMEGELFPFWWKLWNRTDQFVYSDYNCREIKNNETKTIIDRNSMKCTFSIYDGNLHQQIIDNPLNTFEIDCYQNDSFIIFDYFKKAYKIDFDKVAGKYVYNTKFMFDGKVNTYGEYKLVLERVNYKYCDPSTKTWQDGRTYQGVCEVDFALTKPYIMQISTFGISPTATSASDFLEDFYDMKGHSLVSKTDIKDTISVDPVSYGFNNEVSKQMSAFKQKYEALSIAVEGNFKVRTNKTINDIFSSGTVKKVPNQMIFFVKGDDQLTLKQLTDHFPGTPFTIYVEGMNVLVEGSVKTNGMIITDRKILFEDDIDKGYCEDGGQVVNGIFVAKGGFDSIDRTRNTNKNEKRCPWGNLHVKGVLIGGGIENLVNNRRSHLNEWFSTDNKRLRKNQIFEGSALLIEYNPSLWSKLPPGAESFTKALEIYKK